MDQRPWSNTQLKRLGKSIRSGEPLPANVPSFDEVIVWYNELNSSVQKKIQEIDWTPLLGARVPEVTSRAKTIDTLREKLVRHPRMSLGTIQDLAGVRFEAEMTLSEQDAVANAIAGLFRHEPEPPCLHDLRNDAHSGYRAVHLWLMLSGPVEVQIRTHLQGEWANMYEAAGDLFGRGIRYREMPEESVPKAIVEGLQNLSTSDIANLEEEAQAIQQLELQIAETPPKTLPILLRKGTKSYRESQAKRARLDQLQQKYEARESQVRLGLSNIREALINAKIGK
ncbi:GTP pyrophosphokinase family protein [Cryobacterium sp. SO1]|uniref:GTP pyrophosphokinase family protein n=1 Tax=Cryobacterium sp. SO1 TaxID=1897061 RepID=UPI001023A5D6|nr:GTP pyrophosphokinase family protein [Cryobacterium sp. SO1]RZI36681.1 hypothetical protein BJQ95_00897 [Cryobacterium sp. SO1]